jgi:hypothetical protein
VNEAFTVAAGVAVAVFGAGAVGAGRWLVRWVGRFLHQSMKEAIVQTVQPQLSNVEQKLGQQFELMRAENRVDHDRVATELAALEVRVSAVETTLKEMSTAPEGGPK